MNQIKPDLLLRIEELFLTKCWDINSGNENTLSLFDRFCARLKLLTAEQQLFIIELTYSYTIVELACYLEKFYESLIALGDEIYNSKEKIFVYPLLSPFIKTKLADGVESVKKINKIPTLKTKSSGFLHYMFESDDYTWLSKKFIPNHSIKFLQAKFNNKDSILLLIDDFVGSGTTAKGICEEYLKEETSSGRIHPDNLKIVSIAAQRQGIIELKESLGIDVISSMTFDKGISDKYHEPIRSAKTNLMEQIETVLDVEEEFRFGYKKSEALITMLCKTPNNTFPVYWLETRNKIAPFPRKKKYLING